MVGRCISYWNSPFLGAMLVLGRVHWIYVANLDSAESLSAERCPDQNGWPNQWGVFPRSTQWGGGACYLHTSQQTPKIFICHKVRPFWRGPTTILRGRKWSPCLLITLRILTPQRPGYFEDPQTHLRHTGSFTLPLQGSRSLWQLCKYIDQPHYASGYGWILMIFHQPAWL